MPTNSETLNRKLYSFLLKYDPDTLDSDGKITPVPEDAEVLQFKFSGQDGEPSENAGTVAVSIEGTSKLVVYFDDAASEAPGWTQLLISLKNWAQSKQLGFEPKNRNHLHPDMAKRKYMTDKEKVAEARIDFAGKLQKNIDKTNKAVVKTKKEIGSRVADIGPGGKEHNVKTDKAWDDEQKKKVSEGYYATGKKSSYSDNVPAVKIILQHNRQLEEGEKRYRSIAKIFVENADGERFLLPTNKPGIARVYARHIAEGGTPYDDAGKHINSLVEEYTQMAGFVRATRNNQFNESTQSLVNEGVNHYQALRETLHKMSGHRGYTAYFESWSPTLTEDAEDSTDLSEMFASNSLDPRIESVMPILRKLNKNISEMDQTTELSEWADNIIGEAMGDDDEEGVTEGSAQILQKGTSVTVSHKGKKVTGKIVRYDAGKDGYSNAYVVDIGGHESIFVPASKIQSQGMAEGLGERKHNATWAQIADYEKRAKATSNEIKKQHLMKMASDLRRNLPSSDEKGVAESTGEIRADFAKDQGRYTNDTTPNVSDVSMKRIQVGDTVKYLGKKVEVLELSKDGKHARVEIEGGMGSTTQNVLASDLKQLGQGVTEGSNDAVYPNAEVIKSKNSKPVGEIYQDGDGWGCFHYRADRGTDFLASREDAIEALKDLHQETGRSRPDYTIKGVAEGEKNPHSSALGKALYRDLSKEKKASPAQVEKNKAQWAKNPHNPANKQQGVAEGQFDDTNKEIARGLIHKLNSTEQVYKILAVSKSNALGKKVKLNVKASSLEEVFERLAASDWYPLDINGVEVINGKRLKQGVTEGSLEEVSQDTVRNYAQKASASQKDLINQTHRKGADTGALNKKIQNRQQGMDRAHTDERYYKDDQGVAEGQEQYNDDDWYEVHPGSKKIVGQRGPSEHRTQPGQREVKLPNGNIAVRGMNAKNMGLTRGTSEGVEEEGLDANQKRVGQLGPLEKAKNISPVLGSNPKQHPFNGKLVGADESVEEATDLLSIPECDKEANDPLARLKALITHRR
jgi:hypothetical protein